MEEGFYGHQFESCSDPLLNVPLIFYAPKIFKEKVVSAPVSTLDILPTIADLISVEKPDTARGISLRSILVDDQSREDLESRLWARPLFSEGWRRDVLDRGNGDTSGERVFVVRMGKLALKLDQKRVRGGTFQEKYVLRDWSKNENLEIQQHQSEFNQLRGFLHEHLNRSAEKAVEHVVYTREEEEELRRRLANLGYT